MTPAPDSVPTAPPVGGGVTAPPVAVTKATAPLTPHRAPATAPRRPAPAPTGSPGPTPRFLARATLLTAVLAVGGALLGLVRDQALAHFFGAGRETDAFLVAWTVPEFASTLLIEDGMALVLVPAFCLALARRDRHTTGPDPVRALVAATLPRLVLAFCAVTLLLIAVAPALVAMLAPGLPDPALAVDCTRITSTCVLSFGLAGYSSAALRAHRSFLSPGAVCIAYNTGIISAMTALGGRLGVRAAAVGVAAGGCLMAVAQAPALRRRLRGHTAGTTAVRGRRPAPLVSPALVATVLLFALCRQSQVLIERYLASSLPAGAISHLNYAQKVAQMPMVLSLMLCTVTFPVVARALADGDTVRARDRVERDLLLAGRVVLLGTAALLACAPRLVELLFQRGAFTARDTAATASVMRVYALGLLGHTLVGALVRSYFSAGRRSWYPLAAMTAGAAVTAGLGMCAVGALGVHGIAAANAAGITVTALLLLRGLGPRSVPVRVRTVVRDLAAPVAAGGCATGAGLLCARWPDGPVTAVLLSGTAVATVFTLVLGAFRPRDTALALRTATVFVLFLVRTVTRRRSHAR